MALVLLGVCLVASVWLDYPMGMLMAGVLFLLIYLVLFPTDITFHLVEKKTTGKMTSGRKKSLALLLISEEEIRTSSKKNNFREQDWSLAWTNTLLQEVGSYYICDINKLSAKTLGGKILVVVSKSASKRMGSNPYKLLKKFGGMLIVDFPDSDYAQKLCSIEKTEMKEAHGITNSFVGELRDMPLNTSLMKIANPASAKSYLKIDGEPALCRNGNVVFLLFDYALQLVSLQQGVPEKDCTVKKKYGITRLSSPNLAMSEKMLSNFVPYADLLERAIFTVLEEHMPFPRIWYFPCDYDGVGMVTHDEDEYGDKSTFVSDFEETVGASSTFFIVPNSNISKKALAQINRIAQIGIHWNRYVIKKPLILSSFKPIGKRTSLQEQIVELKKKFPSLGSPLVCRNDGLVWDRDYTNTFQVLCGNGVKMDSTYGPYPPHKGYLFGTGLPFHPMDKNGLPFPIYECPHIVGDYGNISQQDLKRFVEESAEKYHEVLTLLYHPLTIEHSDEIRKQWVKSFSLLKKHKHWIANFEDLYEWFNIRNTTEYSFGLKEGKLIVKFVSDTNRIAFLIPESFEVESGGIVERSITQSGRRYVLVSTKTKKGRIVCRKTK